LVMNSQFTVQNHKLVHGELEQSLKVLYEYTVRDIEYPCHDDSSAFQTPGKSASSGKVEGCGCVYVVFNWRPLLRRSTLIEVGTVGC